MKSEVVSESCLVPQSLSSTEAPSGSGGAGGGGSVAMTANPPNNASEMQLFNVLKRANLLQYFDTFIAQGGDDVQQLCEAGEEEFLEIMALVGMAAKPLHVRRLQKALQEFVVNPAALDANAGYPLVPPSRPAPGSISAVVRDTVTMQVHSTQTTPSVVSATTWTPQPPTRSRTPQPPVPSRSITPDSVPSPASTSAAGDVKEERGGSPMMQPVLMDQQVQAIAMAAESLSKQMPYFQPKDLNSKKPVNREIQNLVSASETSPNRIDELRKYAAIYGRFDSKRKNDRPMSLHEISVNEAAAQLCLHCPTLLTRREDLFPLARQVVRDSGYQYSKGHSRCVDATNRAAEVVVSAKKGRLDPIFQRHFDTSFKSIKQEILDKDQQQERMSAAAQELTSIQQHQEQVKAELAVAREEKDIQQTQKLQSELESLASQQYQVLQENSDLLSKLTGHHSRSKQHNGDDQGKGEGSGTGSPTLDGDHLNSLTNNAIDSFCSNIRDRGIIFEVGVSIARQYNFPDLALELQQLQEQNANSCGAHSALQNGTSDGESVAEVLRQPFELKEVKPGFDNGIADDSQDVESLPVVVAPVRNGQDQSKRPAQSLTVENGVQTVEASVLHSSSPISKGDKPDLKRKAENIETLPSRPSSRRCRSNPNNGGVM